MSARSLLARLRKIEASGQSPMLRKIGSLERFEQHMSQPPPNVDPNVGPFLMACVRSWVEGTHHSDDDPIPKEFNV